MIAKTSILVAVILLLGVGTYYFIGIGQEEPANIPVASTSPDSIQQQFPVSTTTPAQATTTTTTTKKEAVTAKPTPTTTTQPTKPTENSKPTTKVPAGWKMYSYDGYAVAFPSDPRITNSETDAGSGLKMTIVTYVALADNGAAYFLSVTTIPKEIAIYDSRKLLDNAVNATVNQVGGELAFKMDTSSLTGKDSMDFMVNIPDGPRTYAARDIYKDNKLYELRVVYISEKSGDFNGLADSFKFQ